MLKSIGFFGLVWQPSVRLEPASVGSESVSNAQSRTDLYTSARSAPRFHGSSSSMRVADDREHRRRVIILVHENTLTTTQRTAPFDRIVGEKSIPRTMAGQIRAAMIVVR